MGALLLATNNVHAIATPANDPYGAELWWYFAFNIPVPPGHASAFGPMCNRLERANPNTEERPTPFVVKPGGITEGAAWTEIIACGHGGEEPNDGEDAMIAHLDAKRATATVAGYLAELPRRDYLVLEAYYGGWSIEPDKHLGHYRAVARLTKVAHHENRRV